MIYPDSFVEVFGRDGRLLLVCKLKDVEWLCHPKRPWLQPIPGQVWL